MSAAPAVVADLTAQATATLLEPAELATAQLIDVATATARTADFADLFVEKRYAEGWSLDEGRIDSGSYSITQGMSLRAVKDQASVSVCADLINPASLQRLATNIAPAITQMPRGSHQIKLPAATTEPIPQRYEPVNPLTLADSQKISLLTAIDTHARTVEPRVHNVQARLQLVEKTIWVARSDGHYFADVRPMYNLYIAVVLNDNQKVEVGADMCGGRRSAAELDAATVTAMTDKALALAAAKLTAVNAPGGSMPVVLGNGWSGILLHEAIGHGLEGDHIRKGQSAFTDKLGQRIAPPGVTVVDDGTVAGRRGSLNCDDEGTPSACTTLIEDGILCNFMQDVTNASLMGATPTGNGRRQDYQHEPMPRMTNTYMLDGKYTPDEIIASVDKGLYCKSFGGGSVDITNGNFNFHVDEAYLIENGKLGPIVKGATIMGNGPESMTKMSMVADDLELDPGVGTCGKDGQWVPVGVGQPHCKVDEMLVGGTEI